MALQIPIAKAGKGAVFDVPEDFFSSLGEEQQLTIIEEGLKVILNSRMSKLPAPSKLSEGDAEEAKANALAKAKENLDDLAAGKTKRKGATKAKAAVPQKVITEAVRLAREVAKNQLRKAKVKISSIKAAELTAYARKMIEEDPSYIEEAKTNLTEREKTPTVGLDLSKLIATAKAAAEAEKAEKATQLSAKQAGKTETRKSKKVPPSRPPGTGLHPTNQLSGSHHGAQLS